MWLILLRKYWWVVLAALILYSDGAYWHHRGYQAGSTVSVARYTKQHDADVAKLEQDREQAYRLLHGAEEELATEKAAKNAALVKASQAPKVLVKTEVVHDQTCPNISIGNDFERVWNAQSQAAATHH